MKQKNLPGDFGVWLVIYVELATFGALFTGYAIARHFNVDVFNASQLLLNKSSGFLNTLLLITGSWFVIKAIEAIRELHSDLAIKMASRYLLIALGMGAVFIVSKLMELTHIFSLGIHLSTNTFFTFYILLAIFHWMHVVLGMVILFNLYQNTKQGKYTKENHIGLESGALYWHMVDLLWIILFALVYIIR